MEPALKYCSGKPQTIRSNATKADRTKIDTPRKKTKYRDLSLNEVIESNIAVSLCLGE